MGRFRGPLALEENPPLLQLEVCTSDMNATHPTSQRWGCHLQMNGGSVILSRVLDMPPVGTREVTVVPAAYNQTKPNQGLEVLAKIPGL